MKHLRLAGAVGPDLYTAPSNGTSEVCFVDYSHCSVSDICWVLDLGCGCQNHDGCIIDTG